jgi:hypothetical protein
MTPINYEEASNLLGISVGTLKHAIGRGALTRLPRQGVNQLLMKEQVELFKGKRLSLSSLSNEARARWHELHDSVTRKETATPATPAAPTTININMEPDQFVKALVNNGLFSPGGSLNFHSALVDETGSRDEEKEQDSASFASLVVILLGLVVLFFILAQEKTEAKKQAERTIERLGLEPEDLATNQREAIAALRSHPREAQQLKKILESEDLLAVA